MSYAIVKALIDSIAVNNTSGDISGQHLNDLETAILDFANAHQLDLNNPHDVQQVTRLLSTGRIEQVVNNISSVSNQLNIDLSLGNHFEVTLTENTQINIINPSLATVRSTAVITVKQDVPGGRIVTLNNTQFQKSSSDDLTFSTGGSQIDRMYMYFDGAKVTATLKTDIVDI